MVIIGRNVGLSSDKHNIKVLTDINKLKLAIMPQAQTMNYTFDILFLCITQLCRDTSATHRYTVGRKIRDTTSLL